MVVRASCIVSQTIRSSHGLEHKPIMNGSHLGGDPLSRRTCRALVWIRKIRELCAELYKTWRTDSGLFSLQHCIRAGLRSVVCTRGTSRHFITTEVRSLVCGSASLHARFLVYHLHHSASLCAWSLIPFASQISPMEVFRIRPAVALYWHSQLIPERHYKLFTI